MSQNNFQFFIHIGNRRISHTEELIGLFAKASVLESQDNIDAFPELFDEDEAERFDQKKSILLYQDGYFEPSGLSVNTLVKRPNRLMQTLLFNKGE